MSARIPNGDDTAYLKIELQKPFKSLLSKFKDAFFNVVFTNKKLAWFGKKTV